jgi:hypothetical protein
VLDHRLARAATIETGDLYERTKGKFIATIEALSDEKLQVQVPATPDWSVRDALAHVVGLAADLNAQRFPTSDDVGGEVWTALQVERGRGRTLGEVITEWDREAPPFEDGLRVFGYETGSHFVADLYAHYQDVRHAIGLPADTGEPTVRVALDHYLGFVDEILIEAGWGTLDVVVGEKLVTLVRRDSIRRDCAPSRSSSCAPCPAGVRLAKSVRSTGKATGPTSSRC